MKKKKFLGLAAFIVASALAFSHFSVVTYAATEKRDVLGEGTDYTAIVYDSSNGLPTSEANAIVQSSDGFIWIGGYSGFIRYDGTNFYRFDSSVGISSVFSLYVDSKDRIWIGTNENGVAYYDHGTIKVYGRVEGLKSNSIRAITEDKEGNILVATTQGLAYIGKDDMTLHVIDDPQVNLEYLTDLQKDSEGNVYGLTSAGAVFVVENLRLSAFYPPENFGESLINAIYPDPDNPGNLYLGNMDSSILLADTKDMSIKKEYSAAPQKNINALLKRNGKLWVAATNGIGFFDEYYRYTELSDVSMNNSVGNIMTDHENNMWFTSTRQGVLKIVPDRFTDLRKLTGYDPVVVNSTCINGANLYTATDKGLIISTLDGNRLVTNELTEYLKGVRIRCIKNDRDGNLWLCTHGDTGFVCYNPMTKQITNYNEDNGLDSARVRACMQRADGSMAAATGNGLFIIKDGKVTEHYGQENGVTSVEILSVEEGPDGKLYLGSDGGGIYVIDGTKVLRLGAGDGLTSEVVMRIKWDPERELFWLITSNSIEYMKDGKITAVTNFPYSNNYDIYFDAYDGAWVLSSNGIYITKASQLLEDKNIEYTFYNTRSGLPYVATGNSRSYITEDGKLYISGTTGVCLVDINSTFGNEELVKLVIPSVSVDDRPMTVTNGGSVFLPAGSKRVDINAYAITYGLSNPRISYMLEGFDREPVLTTKQDLKTVSYTNLDGGKYVFRLNVINNITGEVERSVFINITKERSAYESIWFWFILVAVVVSVIAVMMFRYFKKKTQILMKKQAESQKFIDEIIHTLAKCIDMRDTMNRGHSFRVAIYTKMLAKKLAEKRGYSKEQIDEFYNVALLHDIGKLSIPDVILNKPERLNDEEYAVMKTHAIKGAEILKDVKIVKDLAYGAGYHHERMDGKGYPNGLKGGEIPEVARIIAVADTFDAMYSTRPYRKILDLNVVIEEIKRIRGSQLEEEVVDALLELAAEGKIDKEKIDAAVTKAPTFSSLSDVIAEEEREKERQRQRRRAEGNKDKPEEIKDEKEKEQEDREFINNLGLGKGK